MAKNSCHHSIFTMFTMNLAALLLWCSSLTVSCRPTTQNTNMAEVKTDGGYQSTFEELPGYFVQLLMAKPAKPEKLNYPETVDETVSNQAPPAQTAVKTSIDTEAYDSFCTGTHIGSGVILTAAHCIDDLIFDFTSGSTPSNSTWDIKSNLSRLGLKYNRMVSGTKQPAIQNSAAIEAVVLHHGYFELLPDRPTPITRNRFDLALIKTSGLDFADAANLPALSEHHLSAAQLSGKTLLVYGASRENAAFVSRQLSTLGIPYIQPTNLHHLGPKYYFWGKITATTLDPQRLIDLHANRLIQMTPNQAAAYYHYYFDIYKPKIIKQLNGKTKPQTLPSYINNYVYPSTFQHEDAPTKHAYSQEAEAAYEELKKPVANRNPQIIKTLSKHQITMKLRRNGLYPASTNSPMVVTEAMPDHTPGRVNGICAGDSGGALMDQQGQTIVGVLSFVDYSDLMQLGSRCKASYSYSVSTYHHLNWINAAKASILSGHHQLPTYNQTPSYSSSSSTLQDNDLVPDNSSHTHS